MACGPSMSMIENRLARLSIAIAYGPEAISVRLAVVESSATVCF